jgi:outer membrane receptor protein involved in Fe transport
VPKVGLVYAPTGSVNVHSTWGKAFRAPNIYDISSVQQLAILDLPDPGSTSGSSPVLVRTGGNPGLRPESAEAWSIGADYSPPQVGGLQLSATAFNIKYINRISQISNPYAALSDPLDAPFITASPSASLAQSVYDSYPPREIYNESGAPFSPSNIGAILDARQVNVSRQTARGADASISYRIGATSSIALLFFNGTYLKLTQQNTPQSPQQTLSGLAFYPSKFRLRSGATWKLNSWGLTGTVNYLARETNSQVVPFQSVGSWTTVDATLRYAPTLPGVFAGLNFNLAAINLFDRDPPFLLLPAGVIQGLNFDSSNTSPVGRFLRLQVSKQW